MTPTPTPTLTPEEKLAIHEYSFQGLVLTGLVIIISHLMGIDMHEDAKKFSDSVKEFMALHLTPLYAELKRKGLAP